MVAEQTTPVLSDFELVIINSSGGKDSLCAIYEMCRVASKQGYPKDKMIISHQDLGESEWAGTKELVIRQAEHFGLHVEITKRKDKNGYEESLLEYVRRRGKWPSSTQRYCTSDFKRGPGATTVTKLTKGLGECNVLHVFGFRADESPSRSKKEGFAFSNRLSTKKRQVFDYLPIHNWTTEKVWHTIKENRLPYHSAYDAGMPRLSCVFCIFSPFDALVIAGKKNPRLLQKYVEVEKEIGHSFKKSMPISKVQEAIQQGYEPKKVSNWVM